MLYELMDIETGNTIGVYETEAAALAEVRALLRANGLGYARALSLSWDDGEAEGPLAVAEALAARATAALPSAKATRA
jgi:hypothetical protein